MPKVHIVGRMQLDENPRKRSATPEDYASMAEGALKNGNDFYQAALTYGIHNPQLSSNPVW